MNKYLNIGIILLSPLFFACEDEGIDSIPLDFGDARVVASDSTRVVQFINNIYTYVPDGYTIFGGNFLEGASDNGMVALNGSGLSKMGTGAWGPSYFVDNPLDNAYSGIRATYVYQNQVQPLINDAVISKKGKEGLMGQVYFLRALYNFQILERFGGYPIAKSEIPAATAIDIPRAKFDDAVKYISSLCDSAVLYLPDSYDAANLGRATKGAALALQTRLLLYAASPLYNDPAYPQGNEQKGSYDSGKWELAASKAAELINMDIYSLAASRVKLFASLSDKEIIFNKLSAAGNALESFNAPPSLEGGRGGTCPTLDLVDSYGMSDGTAFSWNNGALASAPFKNRDPRFYEDILYHGARYIDNHEVDSKAGGLDATGIYATKTGFYLRKFMNLEARWWGTKVNVNHSFILFRYAEVLLNYAEAMNEAYGPDNDPKGYGMTARQAIAKIRQRAALTGNVDLSATVPSGDAEAMRNAIRQERRVELAFEDHRNFDLRRWKIAENVLNKPVRGLKIEEKSDGTFVYSFVNAEARVFKPYMYYYPFPRTELKRNIGLVQNAGWE